MLTVRVDIPTEDLSRKAAQLPAATRNGLKRVAEHAQQIAVRQVGNIDRRKVPTRGEVNAYRRRKSKSKRRRQTTADQSEPVWERDGKLMRAVQAEPVFEKNAISLKADVEYAKSRHQLGADQYGELDPWTPKNPALGIVRKNAFFAETEEIIEPQLGELFEDGFNEVWDD